MPEAEFFAGFFVSTTNLFDESIAQQVSDCACSSVIDYSRQVG